MYTLPKNTRITFRELDKPLAGVVRLADNTWQGARVSIEFRDRIEERTWSGTGTHHSVKVFLLDLVTGSCQAAQTIWDNGATDRKWDRYGRRVELVAGTIVPGVAAVVVRSGRDWRTDRNKDITFCMNSFSDLDDVKEDLDVVRDAILLDSSNPEDVKKYMRLAKLALPKTWPLFLALIRKERTMLKGL